MACIHFILQFSSSLATCLQQPLGKMAEVEKDGEPATDKDDLHILKVLVVFIITIAHILIV